jgi:hypothetical protein
MQNSFQKFMSYIGIAASFLEDHKNSISIDEKSFLPARSRYHCKLLPWTVFLRPSISLPPLSTFPGNRVFYREGKLNGRVMRFA